MLIHLAPPAIRWYRICPDNGDRTVNQGFLLVTYILYINLVSRILSQDLVTYLKELAGINSAQVAIKSDTVWTLFVSYMHKCLLKEATPFIHIFVLLLIKKK